MNILHSTYCNYLIYMISAHLPSNEGKRLAALRHFEILDSEPEQSYDDLTYIASVICQMPIVLVSLIDEHRHWFKSKVGLAVSETSRETSFCAHAILRNEVMVVPDAHLDERFQDNPLVLGDPNIRFYAGAPLYSNEGFALGTLCVIDSVPRTLSEQQVKGLEALARQVSSLIEMRHTLHELHHALSTIKLLGGIVPICASCKKIKNSNNQWTPIEEYIAQHSEAKLSQGICPACATVLYPNYFNPDS